VNADASADWGRVRSPRPTLARGKTTTPGHLANLGRDLSPGAADTAQSKPCALRLAQSLL